VDYCITRLQPTIDDHEQIWYGLNDISHVKLVTVGYVHIVRQLGTESILIDSLHRLWVGSVVAVEGWAMRRCQAGLVVVLS
jgi:hypothetical protein